MCVCVCTVQKISQVYDVVYLYTYIYADDDDSVENNWGDELIFYMRPGKFGL